MENVLKNVLKTTLTKENYEKVIEHCKTKEDLEFFVALYHKLRDKEKFNKAIKLIFDEEDSFIRMINIAISLTKKKLKLYEKLKRVYILNYMMAIHDENDGTKKIS